MLPAFVPWSTVQEKLNRIAIVGTKTKKPLISKRHLLKKIINYKINC